VNIAVAGATGVLGRALIPLLLAQGHCVRALARAVDKARAVLPPAADIVAHDLLAPQQAETLPARLAGCDAVLHIATAIPADMGAPGAWDANTRLRTEATEVLLTAAREAGVVRYLQQSITMAYPDCGDAWIDEAVALDQTPRRGGITNPVVVMEGLVRTLAEGQMQWCILRGGSFVGPGTFQAGDIAGLRAGTLTVPCDGRNYISLIHVDDMAAAFAAALVHAPNGAVFNIVDEPLRNGDYLDRLADAVGCPPPPRALDHPCPPSWRCSNAAARAVLGWTPRHSLFPQV
jgi:nucleoside-diphosphate-sugar epimerase